MQRIIRRIPKKNILKSIDAKPLVTFTPPFKKKPFTSSAIMASALIGTAFWHKKENQRKLTPEEKAKEELWNGITWHLDERDQLTLDDIPNKMVEAYLAFSHKPDFAEHYRQHLQLLVRKYNYNIKDALQLLLGYTSQQQYALKHLHPSEIAGLNLYELSALIRVKEYGVKAEDIRHTNSIGCKSTANVFVKLVEDQKMKPKDALAEIIGLEIRKEDPKNSIKHDILNAVALKFRRHDILLLLNGKSISEIDSNSDLQALFKIKLEYITDAVRDKSLFALLAPLTKFTPLQQRVLHELYWESHLPFSIGVNLIQTGTEDELRMFDTRKYRRLAYKIAGVTGDLLHDKDLWFNTSNHAYALENLHKTQHLKMEEAVQTLKSIQDQTQIDCIAKGASVQESASMNENQKHYLLYFSEFNFKYVHSPECKLTASLALKIKSAGEVDHAFWNFEKFLSSRIPAEDSIKMINLMDKSAHDFLYNESHYHGFPLENIVQFFLKPRYHDTKRKFIKRDEVKQEWTETTRDKFHPAVILSAILEEKNHNPFSEYGSYDFSYGNNPYAVSELAFHVMGSGRDFFVKISDEKPVFNKESIENFHQVKTTLREQFPELSAFADALTEKSKKGFHPFFQKPQEMLDLVKTIEEKFGKEMSVPVGLHKPEETVEKSRGLRR